LRGHCSSTAEAGKGEQGGVGQTSADGSLLARHTRPFTSLRGAGRTRRPPLHKKLLGFCDESFQPAQDALPALAMGLGLVEVAGEAFLGDTHARSRA